MGLADPRRLLPLALALTGCTSSTPTPTEPVSQPPAATPAVDEPRVVEVPSSEPLPALSKERLAEILAEVAEAERLHEFEAARTKLDDALATADDEPRLLDARDRVEAKAVDLIAGRWLKSIDAETGSIEVSVPADSDHLKIAYMDPGTTMLAVRCSKGRLKVAFVREPRDAWAVQSRNATMGKQRLAIDGDELVVPKPRRWLSAMATRETESFTMQPLYSKSIHFGFDTRGSDRVAAFITSVCPG